MITTHSAVDISTKHFYYNISKAYVHYVQYGEISYEFATLITILLK